MPHLSRYKLSPKQVDQLAQKIVNAALSSRSRHELTLFFDDLLTQTEKAMLGKRFLIAIFLERRYSHAAICNILKVSEATIGTVSERMQKSGEGFRLAIEKLGRQEKVDAMLHSIEKMFKSVPRLFPPATGSGRWNFLRK